MTSADQWQTLVPGEKVQPEPYHLVHLSNETVRTQDSRNPRVISDSTSLTCDISEFSFCQTELYQEPNEDGIPAVLGEGQQFESQELVDGEIDVAFEPFEDSLSRPLLPQILATMPGSYISQAFLEDPYFQPFSCVWPGCKARKRFFSLPADLDHHVQTYHLHRCPWPTCRTGKPFRRRSDLTRHLGSVHSGSRKHRCVFPGCEKAYGRSDKLTAHRRTHEKDPAAPEFKGSSFDLASDPYWTFGPWGNGFSSSAYYVGAPTFDFGMVPSLYSPQSSLIIHSPSNELHTSPLLSSAPSDHFLAHENILSERPQLSPEQGSILLQANEQPLPTNDLECD